MVSDLNFFAYKWCKIAAIFFFGEFYLTSRIFLVSVVLSASVERCFFSRMRDFFSTNIPVTRTHYVEDKKKQFGVIKKKVL